MENYVPVPKMPHREEVAIVSKIEPKFRRFDEIAAILAYQNIDGKIKGNISVCFDGKNILFASNSQIIYSAQKKCLDYLQYLTTVDYKREHLYNEINLKRQDLYNNFSEFKKRFKIHLLRLEGSIIAGIIGNDKETQKKVTDLLFFGNSNFTRPKAAFPTEYVQAFAKGVKIILAENESIHSELKIIEYLINEYRSIRKDIPNIYMGNDKKCCLTCENIIKAFNNAVGRGTEISFGDTLKSTDRIVTRDLLTTGHGHGSNYPAPIPSFIINPKNAFETIIRQEFFRLSNTTKLGESFSKIKLAGQRLARTNSLSPTFAAYCDDPDDPITFLSEKLITDLASVTINKQPQATAAISAAVIEPEQPQATAAISAASEELPLEVKPPNRTARLAAEKRAKAAEGKAAKQALKAPKPIEETESENPEIAPEIEENISPNTKPIIFIVFDTDLDSTSLNVTKSILKDLKENYHVENLVFEDPMLELEREITDPKKLYKHFKDTESLCKRNLEKEEKRIKKDKSLKREEREASLLNLKSREALIEIAEKYKYLFDEAFKLNMLTKNISPDIKVIDSMEDSPELLGIVYPVFEEASSNISQAFISEESIEAVKRIINLKQEKEIGRDLVNQIDEICKSSNKSVVAILKWDRAYYIQEMLSERGYEDCRSIFPFNPDRMRDALITDYNHSPVDIFVQLFLLRNQDYANAMILPNVICLNQREDREARLANIRKFVSPVVNEALAIDEIPTEASEMPFLRPSIASATPNPIGPFTKRLQNEKSSEEDKRDELIINRLLDPQARDNSFNVGMSR